MKSKLGDKLKELLTIDGTEKFDRFYVISAYVKRSGVSQLKEAISHFRDNGGKVNCVAGIDQKNTSIEGIRSLFEICDELYIYHSEAITQTFHPKLYALEKENIRAIVFVGSNNLTEGGLFTNYEASYSIELDLNQERDKAEFNAIKEMFRAYSDVSSPCCKEVDEAFIQELIDKGYIFSENILARQIKKIAIGSRREKVFGSEVFRVPRVRQERRDEVNEEELISMEPSQIPNSFDEQGPLIWKKEDLPSSDAQIVSGSSHITGVLRLSQARFRINNQPIDHKKYFINSIFRNLEWNTEYREGKQPLLVAFAKFQIKILGAYKGEYELKISHDVERIAGQDNVPTTLHWGEAIRFIQEQNLIGKNLFLYAPPTGKEEPYFIEIR